MSAHPPRLFEFGPFSADPVRRVLRQHGEIVPLTGKAFDLLMALLERAGDLVEKDELFRLVWGDASVEESNLVRHVSMLRRALGDDLAEHRYIVTATGHGYRFVADVAMSTDDTASVDPSSVDVGDPIDTLEQPGAIGAADAPRRRQPARTLRASDRPQALLRPSILLSGVLLAGALIGALVSSVLRLVLRRRHTRLPTTRRRPDSGGSGRPAESG